MTASWRPAVAALAVVLPCVLALVGCGTGNGSGGAVSPFPPRPVSVPADRIAPCSMLSPDQARRLTLTRSRSGTFTVNGLPSPACSWRGTEFNVNVQYIPIPAATALTAPGAMVLQVNGFGAVQDMSDFGGPPTCEVAVDVADNRTIRVQASFLREGPTDNADLCRRTLDATSMVMTTVVAMTPR